MLFLFLKIDQLLYTYSLSLFQLHNAQQLSKWCLHFIASNYIAFENREDFPQLKGDNKDYIEGNRWPPLSYLKEVDDYEKLVKKDGDKCSIM